MDNAIFKKIGYCPWCGYEIQVDAVDIRANRIEWKRCSNPNPCNGKMQTVITDHLGFVLYPLTKKNYYVFSRKLPKGKT